MDHQKLGQILIDKGIINSEQLETALGAQRLTGKFFGEILVSRGFCTEEQIAKSLSEQLGFAFIDVGVMPPEPKVIEIIPKEFCLKYSLVPLYTTANTMTVAMMNALDVQAVDALQAKSGMRIKPVFACPSAIRQAVDKGYGSGRATPASPKTSYQNPNPVSGAASRPSENYRSKPGGPDAIASLAQAASMETIVEKVGELIRNAVDLGASDIHLEPEKNKMNCRYRVDGILQTVLEISAEDQAAVLSRIKIMSDMDIAEKRLPQDGRAQMDIRGRHVDFRVSTFPTLYGENVVIRILDRSMKLLRLMDLGFSKANLETFQKVINRPYGMVLVAGPTGSGKTTSLYAALNEINSQEKNIITLEDPVEYELAQVRQSQINVKAGLTFANGLRSILRQDPDIIMIGEIRDKETAEIAIHAALTGHLVFSTIHTNDAPSGFTRLIDMGVEPFLVASSVICILAQRLVRTLCPDCKSSYNPAPELLSQLSLTGEMKTGVKTTKPFPAFGGSFAKEVGCPSCKNMGYVGRSGIYEILTPNEKIKELITRKASALSIWEEATRNGMKSLREAGIEKVIEGVTSVSELLRVTEDI